MENSVFKYSYYKDYLKEKIETYPNNGRGVRRQLAEVAGCQVAYISHILAGDRDLSLEQAEAITRFFHLRTDEVEYFLVLVEKERAGTVYLKRYFAQKLEALLATHRQIKNRVRLSGKISSEDQAVYYSSWHFQAIRMALTIPNLRTAVAIGRKLNLSIERVNEVLEFFLEKGFIQKKDDGYHTTDVHIHVGNDSKLINRMHANWRLQTLNALDKKNVSDLHYSAAVTLSEKDYQKVREVLLEAITDSHKVIRPSKEEKLCVMALDFYEI